MSPSGVYPSVPVMSQAPQTKTDSTAEKVIRVSEEVRNELFNKKEPGDSYDDVLRRELALE